MTTKPLRAPPVFASADSATVPGAFPLAPLVTWIHGVWLTAVQAHPVSVSTASEMPPPDADTDEVAGVTVNLHGAASCVIVSWVPLTSSVPRRTAGAAFPSTRYETVPLPWPVAVDVRAIQFTPLVASQVQSRVVVTDSVPFAPAAGGDIVEPSTVTWHLAALGDVEEIDVARPHAAAVTTANAADRIAAVRS
jgi:hypothetical protein